MDARDVQEMVKKVCTIEVLPHLEPSEPWPRPVKDYHGASATNKKKSPAEQIILDLERKVSASTQFDFYLETMQDIARVLGDRYLK